MPGPSRVGDIRCAAPPEFRNPLAAAEIERLSDGAAVPADPSVANQLSAFVTAGIRGAMASFAASANTPASEAWGNAE